MSNKNDDFWKELMGEDFKVGDLDSAANTPPPPKTPEKPENPQPGKGFTIEFVDREGQAVTGRDFPPLSDFPGPAEPPEAPEAFAAAGEPDVTEGRSAPAAPGEADRDGLPWFAPGTDLPGPAQEPAGVSEPASPAAPPRAPRGAKKSPEDDFEVEFDFDSEYADVDEKAIRRGRTKRTGCLSGILMFLFIICVSVVLASLGWLWATDVLGLDGDDEPVEVTLPKEIFHTEERKEKDEDGNKITVTVNVADIDKVAEELYNKGLIRYKWLFKLFSKFSDAEIKVQAGTYTLNMNYDYRALVHGMNPYTGTRKEVWVTVPEGYTITQIVALIESKGVCDSESMLDALANYDFHYDFLDSATLGDPKRLEGYLFPDSYLFYESDDAPSVIAKFLDNFAVKWTEEFDEQAAALGYTRDEVITIASMIEKEAGSDTERDSIASVIYNRLNNPDHPGTNGYLQVDATINYIIADTGEDFSTEIDSPYNTYLYPGLPAGPISNPGIASIRAALDPAETRYYYYALGKNGLHRFFETYEGFLNFVNSDQYGG